MLAPLRSRLDEPRPPLSSTSLHASTKPGGYDAFHEEEEQAQNNVTILPRASGCTLWCPKLRMLQEGTEGGGGGGRRTEGPTRTDCQTDSQNRDRDNPRERERERERENEG